MKIAGYPAETENYFGDWHSNSRSANIPGHHLFK